MELEKELGDRRRKRMHSSRLHCFYRIVSIFYVIQKHAAVVDLAESENGKAG